VKRATTPSPFARAVALGVGRRYSPVGGRIPYLLREFRAYLQDRKTLDVGAGNAGATLQQALGSTYHALDIGESYKIHEDRERGALNYVADIEKEGIPLPDQTFDTVLCLDVLEHVDDPHRIYAELFRLARRNVIISLPNNWPTFLWSMLAGRNVTHRAGYGLGAEPKRPGERHKHFFNIEEALAFLTDHVPAGFHVARVDCVFEHGNDGLLASHPLLSKPFRIAGKARLSDARERYGATGLPLWLAAKAVWLPARALDIALSALFAGWGDRARFYNLFCRQLWVVFETDTLPATAP
jgi:2-polyprenyl-3-methyl-5-hydroxy-6-metoxy-1,4-benzoquinol methylase